MARLRVSTNNPNTLFGEMHEKGAAFFVKTEENTYQVLYFSSLRDILFEGELTLEQISKLKNIQEAVQVKSIQYDKFNDTWHIEE